MIIFDSYDVIQAESLVAHVEPHFKDSQQVFFILSLCLGLGIQPWTLNLE